MDSAQRELMCVLLESVFSRGLISKATYLNAEELVYSATGFPELFRYPVCLAKEESN